MPYFVFAGVNETVRYDRTITPASIGGIGTAGLKSCIAVLVVSRARGRYSLTHATANTKADALLNEIAWVSQGDAPFDIIHIINKEAKENLIRVYSSYVSAEDIEQVDTEARYLTFLRENGLFKRLTRRINSPTGNVFVTPEGEITAKQHESFVVHLPENVDLRFAMNMINCAHTHAAFIAPFLEYDGSNHGATVTLAPAAEIIKASLMVIINEMKLEINVTNIEFALSVLNAKVKAELGHSSLLESYHVPSIPSSVGIKLDADLYEYWVEILRHDQASAALSNDSQPTLSSLSFIRR